MSVEENGFIFSVVYYFMNLNPDLKLKSLKFNQVSKSDAGSKTRSETSKKKTGLLDCAPQ